MFPTLGGGGGKKINKQSVYKKKKKNLYSHVIIKRKQRLLNVTDELFFKPNSLHADAPGAAAAAAAAHLLPVDENIVRNATDVCTTTRCAAVASCS